MKNENFKTIMDSVIKKDAEMRKAKEEWVRKIRGWSEDLTEEGTTTLIFSEVFQEEENGYFYRDISLSKENIEMVHAEGTPVCITNINCIFHADVNWSQNGEFYPYLQLQIELIFYSTSDSSYVKDNFSGEIKWKPYLFHTYLDWPREYNGKGIGFASKEFINRSRFSGSGWTMIFDNDKTRKSIIEKLKGVESCFHSLIPKNKSTLHLLFVNDQ